MPKNIKVKSSTLCNEPLKYQSDKAIMLFLCGFRRERRSERATPPPRFARGRGERGGGFDRGGGGRDRGRGRGRGSNAPNGGGRGPPLTKQNSSDMANEEWETASESSDITDRRDSKNDLKDGRDKRDSKKSFSSQRPQNDRQNRRMNSSSEQRNGANGSNPSPNNTSNKNNYDNPKNFHKERIAHTSQTKNGYATPPKNGLGGGKRPPHPQSSKKDGVGVNQVYRVDGVVPNDQSAIDNALSNSISDK